MPDIVMTEAELEVLARCSGVAVKCYLRLRARMDYDSGVVGIKSGMSYQALREWSEEAVEKGAGEVTIQPSMQNVRTAVDQLCRRGLMRRMGTEKLAFLCLLARTGQVRPKRTQHVPNRAKPAEPNTEPNTYLTWPESSNGEEYDVPAEPEPNTEPNTYLTGQKRPNPTDIRYQSKPSTPQAASTTRTEGGAADALSAALELAEGWKAPAAGLDRVSRGAIELTAWLRRNGADVQAGNPKLRAWVEEGIDEGLIARALDVAKDRRGPSPQPVGVGLIDTILRGMLADQARPPRARNWATASDADLECRGRELGLPTMGKTRAEVVSAIIAREAPGEARV
jgi:hypothetical protein